MIVTVRECLETVRRKARHAAAGAGAPGAGGAGPAGAGPAKDARQEVTA